MVAKTSENTPLMCWKWRGCKSRDGYGTIKVNGKNKLAHRVAWELSHGREIPPGLLVRHSCDTPACCNPAHLSLGTDADNKADSVARGRHKFSIMPGETHGMARLSSDQIRAIRNDPRPQRQIAASYGIGQPHVSAIKNGRKWSHI
tara:strand:+ start:62 stop:499 length:438 start_codon:yes stop_codon:yes gene_type:complete